VRRLDCFAEPVIGRPFARPVGSTAMTTQGSKRLKKVASGQNPTLGTRALSDRCHAVAVIPRMPMLACKRSWEVSG
jgi:hypothetical protein